MLLLETKITEQVEVPVLHLVTMEALEHTARIIALLPQGVTEPTIEAPEAINPEVQHRAEVTIVPLPVQALGATVAAVLHPAVGPAEATVVPEAVPEALA